MLEEAIKEHNRLVKSKTNFDKRYQSLTDEILLDMVKSGAADDYYSDNNFVLINGDCIEVMSYLAKSGIIVDHIITDIPYGTVQGLSIEGWKNKGNVPTWDTIINPADMLNCCFNISKSNSNMILFSQEPMTFKLNYELLIFQKYTLSNKMIWIKGNHANGFSAKTTPLNYYEEMLLIRKALDESNSIELRSYFREILNYIGVSKREVMERLGQGLDHCFRYANRTFYIPTEKNYTALIQAYKIDKMDCFIPYDLLKKKWDKDNTAVFNIPHNRNIVKNVFEYKKDTHNIHPTQKPLALLSNLINIFSDEGDTVLDFTCGSASTGIAAIRNRRKFIGIELDKEFYNKAIQWYKCEKAKSTLPLFEETTI